MSKRMAFVLSDEAVETISKVLKETNEGFAGGRIKSSDVVNEMVISSRVDIKALQSKHTDLRRLLKSLCGKKELDAESIMKVVADFRLKGGRKKTGGVPEEIA